MDDNQIRTSIMGSAASVIAVGLVVLRKLGSTNSIPREPHVDQECERERYMNTVLYGSETHCVNQIRMTPDAFFSLCDFLKRHSLVHATRDMPIREQMLIFLSIIGDDVSLRVIGGRFYRSVDAIHRCFKLVLKAVLKLHRHVIKLPDESTPSKISSSLRFYPYFKDCIGALDKTHVRASVPIDMEERFRGPKDGTTQNVFAAVTFDLKFAYVLAGWEGSAHDSRILSNALSRTNGLKIPQGKYYLGDVGFGIRNGVISPYPGVRYHLKEFNDYPPQNKKELFNYRLSSLRTIMDQGLGVLKKRFRALDAEPFWPFETQVDIVLASCIIHNYVMGVDSYDSIMQEVDHEMGIGTESESTQQLQRQDREENQEWMNRRDEIALAMWNDYSSIRLV
ncbi:protein ALP1-like [Tripterygium wilfordii]|uniref:protein ALP1-like n=1 Tax=Tripterygium wilfordii TaxID=458696 RepID=UPI0018F81EBD|nr:protein ALP1-like [Tripterygium wilfordii]XP_038685895.1 protein ALP1-like [Tripterygium wilfordii]